VTRRFLQLGAGLIVSAAMVGCPAPPTQTPPTRGPQNVNGLNGASGALTDQTPPDHGVWHPEPVSLRIYPSTRFVEEDGVPILEARLELFDAMGDSIKSSGTVRCELFALGDGDRPTVGRRLYRWDIEMKTLDEQRRYFDPIIRGYVFRLKMDDIELVRRPTLLRVVFQPPDGPRLKTEGRVRTDW
jgi:hypothetical protein